MRSNIAKALLTLFILAGAGGVLSACHTVQGAGEDISGAGRAVERAF